jgi:hypothetical protein
LSFRVTDYKKLEAFGVKLSDCDSSIPEKGHSQALEAFGRGINQRAWPISLASLVATTRLTISLSQQIDS